jgi:hypothetical protein
MDHDEGERDDGGGVSMGDPAAPLSTNAGDWIDRVEGRVSGGQWSGVQIPQPAPALSFVRRTLMALKYGQAT